MSSYNQVHVECPFFAYDDPRRHVIACEAITRGELPAKRQFYIKQDWEACLKGYCCQHYRYCEHYQMLVSFKYQGEMEQ